MKMRGKDGSLSTGGVEAVRLVGWTCVHKVDADGAKGWTGTVTLDVSRPKALAAFERARLTDGHLENWSQYPKANGFDFKGKGDDGFNYEGHMYVLHERKNGAWFFWGTGPLKWTRRKN